MIAQDSEQRTILAKSIGEAVRAARRTAGLTQEQLASQAKISIEFMGRLERGNALPSVVTLSRIAGVVDIDTNVALALKTLENAQAQKS